MKLNKRLILSSGMLVFVAAVVAGGTGAFFSDTETSTGNVFTAGSVSLDLTDVEHDWLGEDGAIDEDGNSYFQTIRSDGNLRYQFNDLKPLDNGTLTSSLENGANDAFVCKRFTAADGIDEDLASMISIRTGTGPGAPMDTFFETVGLNQWFAPVAPASGDTSLALDANEEDS
ncbi:MAG: SipW-dependent-type signal peptide-containing protein, partial [Patescibacteria group bacterium]